jgi:hypothetical protein
MIDFLRKQYKHTGISENLPYPFQEIGIQRSGQNGRQVFRDVHN